MFDEQAKAYAAQRARQRAAEEAAERVEVDAAKASLLAEERKNARLKKSFQAEQERLAREIIVARKHKEEQKLAEWRENARIDREAREAQDETERRRAMVRRSGTPGSRASSPTSRRAPARSRPTRRPPRTP